MADVIQLRAAGMSLVEMVYALSDGIDAGDIAEGTALITALMGVSDDIKEDADSAILEIVAGAFIHLAAKRRA